MLSQSIANSLATSPQVHNRYTHSRFQLPRGLDLLSSTRAATHQVPAGQAESLQENQFHHSLQNFVLKFEL